LSRSQIVLKGQGVSPGIAIGKVFTLEKKDHQAEPLSIDASLAEQELHKFEQALGNTKRELLEIARTVASLLDPEHLKIFEAQILLLDDPEVRKEVEKEIRENLKSASAAYREVVDRSLSALQKSTSQYLRERVPDVQAVRNRVLHQLAGGKLLSKIELNAPAIILTDTLAPGELIQLNRKNILGLALKEAGATSHVALLSKAFNIPTVVAWEDGLESEPNESSAIIDGNSGKVILYPDQETLIFYQRRKKIWEAQLSKVAKLSDRPAQTKDKVKVTLLANIDIPEEAELALKYGAEGVGLFRTEFLFLSASGFPTEEEQFQIYSKVLEKFYPRPVTIRTTDLGGDKLFGATDDNRDPNPFLGWRAVRVCLDSPALFKTQLRALYRASVKGNLKIMIPMVSCVEEVRQVKRIAKEVQNELRREKVKFNPKVPLGIMVEIPSAALNASGLAKEVDFFSLGTNDLTQYTLAVDRGNKKVGHLFDELNPGVLKLIQMTIQAARKNKIEVSICGELAAFPLALPALIGLGLDKLSVAPVNLPKVKITLSKISLAKARKSAQKLCRLTEKETVRKALKGLLK